MRRSPTRSYARRFSHRQRRLQVPPGTSTTKTAGNSGDASVNTMFVHHTSALRRWSYVSAQVVQSWPERQPVKAKTANRITMFTGGVAGQ